MKIEIAKHQRMAETGSSLLRLIQNNDMPLLDLLVREAVQNSLDAALEGEGYVQVDFFIRDFDRSALSEHFEGIKERMNELYTNERYRLLEIRDTNTQGLTGPLQEQDLKIREYGNLIKLVYHVGIPQQKAGSGGSWGLGKTVYFRIGIGLVIYYSRIYENGTYASRLAACLVEDEEKETALLKNKGNHRGIAWWGQVSEDGNGTIPLTNESEIHKVLKVLGVKPFEGLETGTVIVIPFLRDDLRPDKAESDDEHLPNNTLQPWWESDDESYIKIALQRWYAPRLMNKSYKHGRWLKASVNGELLTQDKFLPAFRVVQELYNAAIEIGNGEKIIEGWSSPIHVTSIHLRGNFIDGSTAGWMAFVKLSSKDLGMLPPDNNYSPLVQALGKETGGELNPPLICFTRKPGMIVGYEYVGKWTEGISKTARDDYIIGLFVANSFNRLKEEYKKRDTENFSLEEYIRGCEKADHASWQDWVPNKKNPLIIEKIQRQVTRNIEGFFRKAQSNLEPQKNELLGRMLAKAILPPEGFGRLGAIQSSNRPTKQEPKKRQGKLPSISFSTAPVYVNGNVKIDFQLYTGKVSEITDLKLGIVTENGLISAYSWEKEVMGDFPAEITEIELKTADKEEQLNFHWKESDVNMNLVNPLQFNGLESLTAKKLIGVRLIKFRDRLFHGSVWIKSDDPLIRISLHTESVLEETVT